LALLVVAFVPEYKETAQYYLAGSLILSASLFYKLMVSSIIGTRYVALSTDIDLTYTWQTRTITIISVIVVYLAGFPEVAFYVLPFLLIGGVTDLIATLMIAGIIDMEESDEDDSDEEEEEESDEEDDKKDK